MPTTIIVQVKPNAGDVVHGKATLEAVAATKTREAIEPSTRKVEIHEGVADTFEVELEDNQKLVIELAKTGRLVYDAAQCSAKMEIDEAPPTVDQGPPSFTQPPAKPQARSTQAPTHPTHSRASI